MRKILIRVLVIIVLPICAHAERDIPFKVTSLSNSGYKLTWTTYTNQAGSANAGITESLGSTYHDERGDGAPVKAHSVSVKGLLPGAVYFYDIVYGHTTDNDNGYHYRVTTLSPVLPQVRSLIAHGRILCKDGLTPCIGALVSAYVTSSAEGQGAGNKSLPVSAVTDAQGKYYFELANLREEGTSAYFDFSDTGDTMVIDAVSADGYCARAEYDTGSLRPVPDLILDLRSSRTDNPISSGDIDGDAKEELTVDFGEKYHMYQWGDVEKWQNFIDLACKQSVCGDFDGNGKDELAVDFGMAHGVWVNRDGTWTQPTPFSTEQILAADIDADGKDEIIGDFGPAYGVYAYDLELNSWRQLVTYSPKFMAAGNMDNIPGEDVIGDFGGQHGIYIFYNNTAWQYFLCVSSDDMVTADINGDGLDEIFGDFGSRIGQYMYYPVTATWKYLFNFKPYRITKGDLDGGGKEDLIVDFGPVQTYVLYNDVYWDWLHWAPTDWMEAADVDGNGQADLVVDFGQYGLWVMMNNDDNAWVQLTDVSP